MDNLNSKHKHLSADRLSLLTEQEHHQYYKDVFNNEFPDFNDVVESAPHVFGNNNLSLNEYKALIANILCSTNDELNIEYDSNKILNEVNQYLESDEFKKFHSLNESGDKPFFGPDVAYWTKGLSWLGPLFAGLIGGAAYGLGKLISAGKQLLAIKKLKNYMDKIVDMADEGYSERVGFFGKIKNAIFGAAKKKNVDMGSFKSQATEINRTFNGAATLLLKNMGVVSGADFQLNGGLYDFYKHCIEPMNRQK